MRKTPKYLAYILASGLLFSSASYADFGSRHADEQKHRKNSKNKVEAVVTQPFDFFDIENILQLHHMPAIEETIGGHIDQQALESFYAHDAFEFAFEMGDELFEIKFNALDGVGVNVGNGNRFTSVPRPDLELWANVMPHRITGPNSDSCLNCHSFPVGDGAGVVNDNAVRMDPEREQKGFIERQSPHLHGMGAQQLLAEEMTTDLQNLRDNAIASSCASRARETVSLETKGIHFGSITVRCDRINYRRLEGVDESLVVKPFEWKGLTAFVRDFARGASHQEVGMQAVELVGRVDADFDGIAEELTVGDITAMTVYMAAQPRPVTKLELNQIADQLPPETLELYGLPLSSSEVASIQRGERKFADMQCTQCHTPALTVKSPTFFEPSRHAEFRDEIFPAGDSVRTPQVALQFDITADLPNNPQILPSGQSLGVFEKNAHGEAIVRLYGDLKRHDMGAALAETIDEGSLGASVFITETLWGVGSTPPYLHDGRATTLTEAVWFHGGEAQKSKELFLAASTSDQSDVLAFMNNLVLFLD